MSELNLREVALLALTLLDLTNLKEDCTEADVKALCKRARTPFGDVAAICIWPRFVAAAAATLGDGSPIRIATVVNFPSGDEPLADVLAETERAIADGADEIDLVMPYKALLADFGVQLGKKTRLDTNLKRLEQHGFITRRGEDIAEGPLLDLLLDYDALAPRILQGALSDVLSQAKELFGHLPLAMTQPPLEEIIEDDEPEA